MRIPCVRRRVRKTSRLLLLVFLTVPLGLFLRIHCMSRTPRGCFQLGKRVGQLAGGLPQVAAWATELLMPTHQHLFFDGVAHTFMFDLSNPAGTVACATLAVRDRASRRDFLRGFYYRYGLVNARRPGKCNSLYLSSRFIVPWERAFGLGNGMAWGFQSSLREGRAYGVQLLPPIRKVFFEELGWQVARRAQRAGGRPDLGVLRRLIPAEHICLAVHGYMRRVVVEWDTLSDVRRLIVRAPESCRLHAVAGSLRTFAQNNDPFQRYRGPIRAFLRRESKRGLPNYRWMPAWVSR